MKCTDAFRNVKDAIFKLHRFALQPMTKQRVANGCADNNARYFYPLMGRLGNNYTSGDSDDIIFN